ncbi:uncharacterized protein BO97DRAFT_403115 [Aspergillus homomorphus CBS 101889]|uniref:Uncharacterized protein n=1 Tax=Aspergillus homomorphus (strain CBS 101889) TaxID=1450537 RepID=A0A395IA03_ASPHC|nr:hypothetical protein BO97DRAFT_403115 [Aspergillus homomorphus CBS 101889]RAL15898.1 hypothetical protein BO97DRAFT_403115 [Aspergillus homomorphus CBS 101889]
MLKPTLLTLLITTLATGTPILQPRDICSHTSSDSFIGKTVASVACAQLTITNTGCIVTVKYPADIYGDSFTFDSASKSFKALRNSKLTLTATPQPGNSAAVWSGTAGKSNPTTYQVPLTGQPASIAVLCAPPPPQCIAAGQPCVFEVPEGCCSGACACIGEACNCF